MFNYLKVKSVSLGAILDKYHDYLALKKNRNLLVIYSIKHKLENILEITKQDAAAIFFLILSVI